MCNAKKKNDIIQCMRITLAIAVLMTSAGYGMMPDGPRIAEDAQDRADAI